MGLFISARLKVKANLCKGRLVFISLQEGLSLYVEAFRSTRC